LAQKSITLNKADRQQALQEIAQTKYEKMEEKKTAMT